MTRVAAIDCGTNSIRLLVAEKGVDGSMVEIDRRLQLVRLGQGVDATGEFHPDALARTFADIDDHAAVIREFGCEKVRFVATSAARDARNRDAFFEGVRSRLGVDAEIIPGTEEAELSFQGAIGGVGASQGPVLVIDIGGGSTELITGSTSGAISHAISLNVGSVRLKERFLHSDPATEEEIDEAAAFIDGLLDGSGIDFASVQTFIGVAGTATSLSAISQGLTEYQRELVHRSRLEVAEIEQLAIALLASPAAEIESSTCLPMKRAEVISGGAMVCAAIARRVRQPMVVSESDILDALALRLLG